MITLRHLKQRARFPLKQALRMLDLPPATWSRWAQEGGRKPAAHAPPPKSHFLLEDERQAVLRFKREHPEIGYRRLAWMMVDQSVAAVSPSSVLRILREANLSTRWTQPAGEAHRKGFVQPLAPHEQWHSDISYLNVAGTHYFFLGVLDGYSRAIVHHEVRQDMTTRDVEVVVDRALERLPKEGPRPRIISDNGPQYISRDFKVFLRERQVSHSRGRPNHPQSNGKLERFHGSLKMECVRREPMTSLDQARRVIAAYVEEYNTRRLHSALGYLTPQDYLRGEEHVQERLVERRRKLDAARDRRREVCRQGRPHDLDIPEAGDYVVQAGRVLDTASLGEPLPASCPQSA